MSVQTEDEYQSDCQIESNPPTPEYEKEDKLNHVMFELRQYCDSHYLPFFKTSNTFTLFEKLVNQ